MVSAPRDGDSPELKKLKDEMRDVRIDFKKLTDQMFRSRESTPTRRLSFSDSPLTSYNCKRQGHVAREYRSNGTGYRSESSGRQSPRSFNLIF